MEHLQLSAIQGTGLWEIKKSRILSWAQGLTSHITNKQEVFVGSSHES